MICFIFDFLLEGSVVILLFGVIWLDIMVFVKLWKFRLGWLMYCIGKWKFFKLLFLLILMFFNIFISGVLLNYGVFLFLFIMLLFLSVEIGMNWMLGILSCLVNFR